MSSSEFSPLVSSAARTTQALDISFAIYREEHDKSPLQAHGVVVLQPVSGVLADQAIVLTVQAQGDRRQPNGSWITLPDKTGIDYPNVLYMTYAKFQSELNARAPPKKWFMGVLGAKVTVQTFTVASGVFQPVRVFEWLQETLGLSELKCEREQQEAIKTDPHPADYDPETKLWTINLTEGLATDEQRIQRASKLRVCFVEKSKWFEGQYRSRKRTLREEMRSYDVLRRHEGLVKARCETTKARLAYNIHQSVHNFNPLPVHTTQPPSATSIFWLSNLWVARRTVFDDFTENGIRFVTKSEPGKSVIPFDAQNNVMLYGGAYATFARAAVTLCELTGDGADSFSIWIDYNTLWSSRMIFY